MRSLDANPERLDAVLDVLVRANASLLSLGIAESLSEIAGLIAGELCDHCEIEAEMPDGHLCRASAGRISESGDVEKHTIAEPLNDGRQTFGRMVCQTSAPSGFDALRRKTLRVLATEIAVILAGRVLIERERRVADRLQRALLPERLPTVPGAEFHAAYRPASDEADVGGDWFDGFALADGRVAISIGDVAGHGLEAAVIMGEMRQAMRTAAFAAPDPAAVLDQVNRMLAMRETVGFVTAIFGVYDPANSLLTYASAGHPPPLLALGGGLVRRLPSGTLPLGCVEKLEARNWSFTIPAGGHVIFYTDGLIENERDITEGERRLADAVRSLVRERPEHVVTDPASALTERIFSDVANADDAAVLFLSRKAPVKSFALSAVPVAAALARAIVHETIAALDISTERRYGILVAVGEAVANAIEHAYRGAEPGTIRIEIENEGNQFVLTVEDFGRWRPFTRREERGRGIELMHAFMDGVQIRSTRESTCVVLKTQVTSGNLSP